MVGTARMRGWCAAFLFVASLLFAVSLDASDALPLLGLVACSCLAFAFFHVRGSPAGARQSRGARRSQRELQLMNAVRKRIGELEELSYPKESRSGPISGVGIILHTGLGRTI